jgi:hypothetical protein
LLGCQAFVGGGTVNLLREVDGEGLHGTDASVVEHEERTKLLSHIARHGVGFHLRGVFMSSRRSGEAVCESQKDDDHQHTLAKPVAAEHTAVGSARVEEHQDEREEEEKIACIGDGDAHGVGIGGECRAPHVVIVGRLIETHRADAEDIVHRDLALCGTVGIGDGERGDVVGGGIGAGMVFHIEAAESNFERQ